MNPPQEVANPDFKEFQSWFNDSKTTLDLRYGGTPTLKDGKLAVECRGCLGKYSAHSTNTSKLEKKYFNLGKFPNHLLACEEKCDTNGKWRLYISKHPVLALGVSLRFEGEETFFQCKRCSKNFKVYFYAPNVYNVLNYEEHKCGAAEVAEGGNNIYNMTTEKGQTEEGQMRKIETKYKEQGIEWIMRTNSFRCISCPSFSYCNRDSRGSIEYNIRNHLDSDSHAENDRKSKIDKRKASLRMMDNFVTRTQVVAKKLQDFSDPVAAAACHGFHSMLETCSERVLEVHKYSSEPIEDNLKFYKTGDKTCLVDLKSN